MVGKVREVRYVIEPQAVVEGGGVRLKRSIGGRMLDNLDPFLLLDHFGSDNPADFAAGFPMHPHRGIETVTYILAGRVHHRDSTGREGEIRAGDVQWMTAGRGIMHEEMPRAVDGKMAGLQLWVNLPARLKMTAPRYQEFASAKIPEVSREGGVRVRVVAGVVDGVRGPVDGIAADPTYVDVTLEPGGSFALPVPAGHSAFAYVLEGEGEFGPEGSARVARAPKLVVWGDGDEVVVQAAEQPARFLLVSGEPLHEPIARYGPFVMNTREEIEETLEELRKGTFAADVKRDA